MNLGRKMAEGAYLSHNPPNGQPPGWVITNRCVLEGCSSSLLEKGHHWNGMCVSSRGRPTNNKKQHRQQRPSLQTFLCLCLFCTWNLNSQVACWMWLKLFQLWRRFLLILGHFARFPSTWTFVSPDFQVNQVLGGPCLFLVLSQNQLFLQGALSLSSENSFRTECQARIFYGLSTFCWVQTQLCLCMLSSVQTHKYLRGIKLKLHVYTNVSTPLPPISKFTFKIVKQVLAVF